LEDRVSDSTPRYDTVPERKRKREREREREREGGRDMGGAG
jgi:hypothetical protein